MENETKHWVENLFSPHFSAQDFFNQSFEPEQLLSEKIAKERSKAVEKIYLDAIERFREADKLKRKEFLSKIIVHEFQQNVPGTTTKHKPSSEDFHGNVGLFNANGNENKCIWTEEELKILRHEMDKTFTDSAALKVELNACKLEIAELKTKQKKTEHDLDAVKEELSVSKKHNRCKCILLKQMEKELLKKDLEIQHLKEELSAKGELVCSLNKALVKTKEEIQDLQLNKKDLEQDFTNFKQHQEFKFEAFIENVKLNNNLEKKKLLKEIEILKGKISSKSMSVPQNNGKC